MRTFIVTLALASLLAVPAFAQPNGAARESAIRECSVLAAPYREPTWGNFDIHLYRTCMSQRGAME